MYKKEAKPELFTEKMSAHHLPTGVTRDMTTDLLRTPTCDVPTKEKLMKINRKWELGIPEYELEKYRDVISKVLMNFDRLEEYPEPKPEVKYPRLPGRMMTPKEKENLHNAWFIKSEIKGSGSGKLQNKKVAIKDNIPIAGLKMRAGSKLLEGFVPDFDATIITKILDAGATISGKANCEDLAGTVGSSMTCVSGPVLNAKDSTRSAGGSSSGPAVLVALNEVDMALGTDCGGHVRIPAALNGVVGMKPTFGLVPFTGILSREPSLDHVGTLAKNVMDCALLLESIAIKDRGQLNALCDIRQPRHFDDHLKWDNKNNLDVLPFKLTEKLTGDIKGLKVGIISESFKGCDKDVETMVKNAAKMLTKAGAASVDEVSIPMHEDGEALYLPLTIEGTFNTIFHQGGVPMLPKGFHATNLKDVLSGNLCERMKDTNVVDKMRVLLAEYIKEKYHDRFYTKAQNLTQLLKKSYDDVLTKYDILITPTTKRKAPKLPKWSGDEKEKCPELWEILHSLTSMGHNTMPFNLTGHPALTINTGLSENLPVGMQIIGREFEDATVLKTAFAFEKIRGN